MNKKILLLGNGFCGAQVELARFIAAFLTLLWELKAQFPVTKKRLML